MLTFRRADYTTVVKFYNWTVAQTASKELRLSAQPTFPQLVIYIYRHSIGTIFRHQG